MQIISFPAHYQSVYTNFDISSFSLISCIAKEPLSQYQIEITNFWRNGHLVG